MAKISPPPQNVELMRNGRITPQWLAYFQQLEVLADLIIDYETPAISHEIFTTDTTLTVDDFGKHIIFEIGTSDVTCNLMSISSEDLYKSVKIFRSGTGKLTLVPISSMRIESAKYGGKFWCNDPKRMAANVTLQPISGSQWAITGATGRWNFE